MLIYEGNLHKKIGAIYQLGAENITFPPKRGCHTDIRTDICFYRVALLLKNVINLHNSNKFFVCLFVRARHAASVEAKLSLAQQQSATAAKFQFIFNCCRTLFPSNTIDTKQKVQLFILFSITLLNSFFFRTFSL